MTAKKTRRGGVPEQVPGQQQLIPDSLLPTPPGKANKTSVKATVPSYFYDVEFDDGRVEPYRTWKAACAAVTEHEAGGGEAVVRVREFRDPPSGRRAA